MMNTIKEKVMVNQLDDRANFKAIDSENLRPSRTNNKMAEAMKDSADTVHLSHTSKQMEALKALILSAPEINAARSAFIKEAIAEGRYTVNNESIAAKMLAEV